MMAYWMLIRPLTPRRRAISRLIWRSLSTIRWEKLKGLKILGRLPERMIDRLREKYGSKDYLALDEEMRKTFVKVVNHDQAALLARIHQPTLLIWGDRDTETPLWMGQQMERDIPDAGLVIFEGGTHFAFLEQVQRFNRVARVFLTGQGA